MVEHAMRIVVKHSRAEYLYPASHFASVPSTTDANVPAMGQRVRLKSSFAIPSTWTKQEKAVLLGLKKYGALVADNGGFFSISVTPDDRYPLGCFDRLSSVAISNFEIVQSTGATQGPRSPGAPTANAGIDQTVTLAAGATLAGAVGGTGVTSSWYLYPLAAAAGTASFMNTSSPTSTVSFSAAGTYTLMLRATDGVHAPAFDAVVITVGAGGTTTGGSSSTAATTSGSATTTSGTTSGTTTTSASASASSGGTTGSTPTDSGGSASKRCGFGAALGLALSALVAWRRRSP
jgi:hypothetical protein